MKKSTLKNVLALLLALSIMFSLLPAVFADSAKGFSDVKENAYYYEAVKWACDKGITTGTAANLFSPLKPCLRCEAITFLWRAFGSPEPGEVKLTFQDVKKDDYFYKAVLWAVEQKITFGSETTKFHPYSKCSRGTAVTFLWRAAGSPTPTSKTNPFIDVKKGAYYYNAVLWAVEQKITVGTSRTTFEPDRVCTRANVVTFLYRAESYWDDQSKPVEEPTEAPETVPIELPESSGSTDPNQGTWVP